MIHRLIPHLLERIRDRRLADVALLAVVLGVLHLGYLLAPAPLWDENMYIEAARLHLEGRSPYEHRYFNYPPPLVQIVAAAERTGTTPELLLAWRSLNLAAVIALAWGASHRTGWRGAGRLAAAVAIGCSPVIGQALDFGNLSPLVAAAALAGLAAERRYGGLAALGLGVSVAIKPVALGAGALLSLHRLLRWREQAPGVAAFAWPLVTLLLVLPGAHLLPRMLERMSRAYYDPHHLSIKRLLAGVGLDVPATWIAVAVVASGLLILRRRPLGADEMVVAAPVVALLALPVVWAHTFAFTLPLQAEAVGILRARHGTRAGTSPTRRDVAALIGVPLLIGMIQASAFALWVNDWDEPVQTLICLLPTVAPAALLAWVWRARPTLAGRRPMRRAPASGFGGRAEVGEDAATA